MRKTVVSNKSSLSAVAGFVRNPQSRQARVIPTGTGLGTANVPRQNVAHVYNPSARGR